MQLDNNELKKISGGEIGASFLNYLTTAVKTVYNIGRELGGAIRRIATGNICPL